MTTAPWWSGLGADNLAPMALRCAMGEGAVEGLVSDFMEIERGKGG